MCNTCNSCGCGQNNGCGCNGGDPLLAALTNLFAPLGCNGNCGNFCGGNLYLVENLGTVQTCGQNNGCGCGNNNGGNGCGCNCGNNGGNGGYDVYYARQYGLCGCSCFNG